MDDFINSCHAEYYFMHNTSPHYIPVNMQHLDSYNMQPSSCKYTLIEHKAVWILIRWLNQKAADLDVQCFQETEKMDSAGKGLRKRIIFL